MFGRVSDIVAFKMIEMSENYTPELSDYKVENARKAFFLRIQNRDAPGTDFVVYGVRLQLVSNIWYLPVCGRISVPDMKIAEVFADRISRSTQVIEQQKMHKKSVNLI